MPCFHPIQGYKGMDGGFQFHPRTDLLMSVPCGQCIGCRLERSRQWAVRIMHEVQMHEVNSFVTLTYRDAELPERGVLVKKDFQDFMKRLRRFFLPERISFYHCGEYGGETYRPHYHAILFGVDFPDQEWRKDNGRGEPLYESAALDRLWGKGDCLIGAVTFESAAYVARYCCAKITGDLAREHYKRVDKETGEVYWLPPEYATMSLKPGIGLRWFSRYGAEVEDSDTVVMRGREMAAPRYYDKLRDGALMKEVKRKRKRGVLKNARDITRARLDVRERVKESQVSFLGRKL